MMFRNGKNRLTFKGIVSGLNLKYFENGNKSLSKEMASLVTEIPTNTTIIFKNKSPLSVPPLLFSNPRKMVTKKQYPLCNSLSSGKNTTDIYQKHNCYVPNQPFSINRIEHVYASRTYFSYWWLLKKPFEVFKIYQ